MRVGLCDREPAFSPPHRLLGYRSQQSPRRPAEQRVSWRWQHCNIPCMVSAKDPSLAGLWELHVLDLQGLLRSEISLHACTTEIADLGLLEASARENLDPATLVRRHQSTGSLASNRTWPLPERSSTPRSYERRGVRAHNPYPVDLISWLL